MPARLANRLLTWFCAPHLLEEVQGDLHERYNRDVQMVGVRTANGRYWLNVLRFMRPFALKRKQSDYSSPFLLNPAMIRNYFKIALRNLYRSPLYSLLNIGGLAIGLAVCMLIVLFVAHELSYDQFHVNAKRLYHIRVETKFGDQSINTDRLSARFGPALKETFPDVDAFVRLYNLPLNRYMLQSDAQHRFFEKELLFADSSFLSVFSFKLRSGDPKALSRPGVLYVSEQMAEKYFGATNPVGKPITFQDKLIFTVAGVLQNPPTNSSIKYDFVASIADVNTIQRSVRGDFPIEDDDLPLNEQRIQLGQFQTFLLLNNPSAVSRIQQALPRLMRASGAGEESIKNDKYTFTPLAEVRMSGVNLFDSAFSSRLVYVFLSIALLILSLALVNYMSLTTARATQRAREVGVRKTMGAARRELALQFYGESALLTGLAFGLAILLFVALRPLFYDLLNLNIAQSFLLNPVFLASLLGLLVVSILLAGSYPALLLSSFAPVATLKGRLGGKVSGSWIRQSLTTFQFVTSIALIVCSLVVQRQLTHMQNYPVTLRKDQTSVFSFNKELGQSLPAVREELQQLPGVQQVSAASEGLFKGYVNGMFFVKAPVTKEGIALVYMTIDKSFLKNMNLSWKKKPAESGRFGRPQTLILNEIAAKKLGIEQRPLGQLLTIGAEKSEVVGIIKDFHYEGLQTAIKPLALFVADDTTRSFAGDRSGVLYVRLSPVAGIKTQVDAIERLYKHYDKKNPFEYYFLDEAFGKLYKSEQRQATIFGIFTGFALFIACLGLFGLAAFSAEQRTKEIGVRKVLGASVTSLVALLSKDFLRLVIIAILIASPIAWWAMNQWLQDFAYKIDIEWWVFALAGGLTTGIALITVSFQSVRAALMNPVKSLRSE